jgi:hypothetical protein
MPRAPAAPVEFLDPNTWAANAPARAAFFGLQMLAPNIASLLTGQPAPALPNFPAMPGKVPSTDDPRIVGAIGEAANIGLNLLPLPAMGLSLGPGRGHSRTLAKSCAGGAASAAFTGKQKHLFVQSAGQSAASFQF